MREFPFQILSPERVVFQGAVASLVVPGAEGFLGVMAGHAPMLAALRVGEVKITDLNKKLCYVAITGGVLEVDDEGATLLADIAEKADDIDTSRAQAAQERAQRRLAEHSNEIDTARAHAALLRALNRLRVAGKECD